MLSNEKIYVVLCTLFAVIVILGNLIYQKFVILQIPFIPPFELSAGALLYPFSFFLTDLIAEFYGKDKATFCVRCSIGASIFVALLILFMDYLPAASWSIMNSETFHNTFGVFSTIFIVSMIACYISQTIDIPLYLAIKKLTKGKYLWARNNGSTAISLLIDTTIFLVLAIWCGLIPQDQLWPLLRNSYSWKLFFVISSTPFFYAAVRLIRWLGNIQSNHP